MNCFPSEAVRIIIHEGDMNYFAGMRIYEAKGHIRFRRVKLVYDPEFNKLEDRIKSLKRMKHSMFIIPFQNIRNKGSLLLKICLFPYKLALEVLNRHLRHKGGVFMVFILTTLAVFYLTVI